VPAVAVKLRPLTLCGLFSVKRGKTKVKHFL